MNKYKICVYAICKNEEGFADRWMDSMSEADLVVVTDTGSTDKTVEKLCAKGATVYVEEVAPWRFDAARNLSLGHVPQDTDICVCTDLDEVFEPGWRQRLEQAWTPDTKQAKYIYNWSHKADGSPDVQIYYSKIHARKGFTWMHPVHEWLSYFGGEPQKTVFIEDIVLHHYPDGGKSRGNYLALLELGVKDYPESDRLAYYLGREYMYRGEWNKCINTLKHHLSLPAAVWNEERSASMRWIAHSFGMLGNIQEAYAWYFRAIAEAPYMRDPYTECARLAYLQNDWPMVFCMAEEALKIKEKSQTYVNMGYAWDHTLNDLCAIACYWLGMYRRSQAHAKAALAFCPTDTRLQNNLKIIEEKLEESAVR